MAKFSAKGIIGKFLGGLIGLALTRHWLGLVVGVALGHAWDQGWLTRWWRTRKPRGAMLVPLFELAGIVARADGAVSEREVAAVETLIARMGLDAANRNRAVIHFDRGRDGDASVDEALDELAQFAGDNRALAIVWLDQLAAIAFADGTLDPNAAALLARSAKRFGVAGAEYDDLIARRARGDAAQSRGPGLADPYAVIGVVPTADEATIRAAWRRLIAQYHPDRQADAASADRAIDASRDAASINAAWEQIRSERGWS